MLYNRRDQLEDPETARLLGMLYKPYKPAYYYWESVVMSFKLVLLVGLVFTEPGTLYQHAAMLAVCAAQLVAQARAQPYNTLSKNALQYMGTFLTFALSFGGMLMQNMKLAQSEAITRLFGEEKNKTVAQYQQSIEAVKISLDVIWVLLIGPAVVLLIYRQWDKRQESKAWAVRLGKKAKRGTFKLAICCGCGTRGMRDYLAAAREEYRRRAEAEEAQREAQGAGEEKHAGDVELTERLGSVVLEHGNPMHIEGDDERAREGRSEADEIRRDVARAGRTGSTAFEEEEGKNSMNPIVEYEAEIKEKRDEKRRSLNVVEEV